MCRTSSHSAVSSCLIVILFAIVLQDTDQKKLGKPFRTFQGHETGVVSICFSLDNSLLASAATDGSVIVWNVTSGEKMAALRGSKEGVNSVAFHPNGFLLLLGGADGVISLWDVKKREKLQTYRGHADAINTVTFLPGGKGFVSGSMDKTACLWDSDAPEPKRKFQHKYPIYSLSVSPNGEWLVTTSSPRPSTSEPNQNTSILTLINLKKKKRDHSKVLNDSVRGVDVDNNNNKFVTASWDGKIKLWDIPNINLLRTLSQSHPALSVAFSPSGDKLISGSLNGSLDVWSEAGKATSSYMEKGMAVFSTKFSPNGKMIAAGFADLENDRAGKVLVWMVR